jgi:hypothetical protein
MFICESNFRYIKWDAKVTQFKYMGKFLSYRKPILNQFFLSPFNKEKSMDCKKDSSRLNKRAHQILSTEKPAIKLSANKIMMALIINRNNPKVRMVTGKVNMTSIGFTIKFNKLSTKATIMAVV